MWNAGAVIFVGVCLGVIGGAMTYAGFGTDTGVLVWAGWAFGAIGGAVVFVGLVGAGVVLGINSARR